MILDAPRALPDHEAQDDLAEWACGYHDTTCCSGIEPDPPSKRLGRIKRISAVVLGAILGVVWMGEWLN